MIIMKLEIKLNLNISILWIFVLICIGSISGENILAEEKVTLSSEPPTVMQLPLNGNYTVGQGGDFESISLAALSLSENGISGNVVFEILAGTYQDTIIIDSVAGAGLQAK